MVAASPIGMDLPRHLPPHVLLAAWQRVGWERCLSPADAGALMCTCRAWRDALADGGARLACVRGFLQREAPDMLAAAGRAGFAPDLAATVMRSRVRLRALVDVVGALRRAMTRARDEPYRAALRPLLTGAMWRRRDGDFQTAVDTLGVLGSLLAYALELARAAKAAPHGARHARTDPRPWALFAMYSFIAELYAEFAPGIRKLTTEPHRALSLTLVLMSKANDALLVPRWRDANAELHRDLRVLLLLVHARLSAHASALMSPREQM